MGKRTVEQFERREGDYYPTPYPTVLRLIPHLERDGVRTFAEMCAGGGDVVRHLGLHGYTCVYSGDIVDGRDALKMTFATYNGAHTGITNPPFSYGPKRSTKLLRDLLQHLLSITPAVPFWLLLPHDFLTNEHAAPFLKRATDIVAIGRIQWIAGSKSSGKDNNVWVRFDARHYGLTAFYNDRDAREDRCRNNFFCRDCRYDTSTDEYFMLQDEVWQAVYSKRRGMLCIGYVEARLGRRLCPDDFIDMPINDPASDETGPKSARLLSRIAGFPEAVVRAAEAAE